jgi:hypothetical protein
MVHSMDSEIIGRALERRLRDRALRAESQVELNTETIERWVREELESIMREHAFAQHIAVQRTQSN